MTHPKPPVTGPGTLRAALEAEKHGLGAVRFFNGKPRFIPGATPVETNETCPNCPCSRCRAVHDGRRE